MITYWDDPDEFSRVAEQFEALKFKRNFAPDVRINDIFKRDDMTIENGGRTIYIVVPSDGKGGYAVLDQEAVAPISDELVQVLEWDRTYS